MKIIKRLMAGVRQYLEDGQFVNETCLAYSYVSLSAELRRHQELLHANSSPLTVFQNADGGWSVSLNDDPGPVPDFIVFLRNLVANHLHVTPQLRAGIRPRPRYESTDHIWGDEVNQSVARIATRVLNTIIGTDPI